jgi:DNA repair exonuclease SbcCD ATPase subunit
MIEQEAETEMIYEPKYNGKDHSGYETMMKYEINDERFDAFVNGATYAYQTFAAPLKQEIEIWKSSNKEAVQLWKDKTKEIESLKKQLEETQNAFNNNYNELMELAAHAKDLEKQLEEWKALAEDLGKICEMLEVPQILREYPRVLAGKPTNKDIEWARQKIEQLKSQMIK